MRIVAVGFIVFLATGAAYAAVIDSAVVVRLREASASITRQRTATQSYAASLTHETVSGCAGGLGRALDPLQGQYDALLADIDAFNKETNALAAGLRKGEIKIDLDATASLTATTLNYATQTIGGCLSDDYDRHARAVVTALENASAVLAQVDAAWGKL